MYIRGMAVNEQDARELANKLIDKMRSGEHTPFEKLDTYSMLYVARRLLKITKKFIKAFEADAKRCFNIHLKNIDINETSPQYLFVYKTYMAGVKYYTEEAAIIKSEIDECTKWMDSASLVDYFKFKYKNASREALAWHLD